MRALYHALLLDTKAALTRLKVVLIARFDSFSEAQQVADFGGGDDIRFESVGRAGVVTLNRPNALNALTHAMVVALSEALERWRTDPTIRSVIIRAEGRAFCAGGDIQAIYRAGREGNPLIDFFADEYRLNEMIASYPKPFIALIDGIVMGGGVGVSIHGSHRIFTENARFAMPEVTIGFFPDVGGSRFLPRLPGQFGLWLGLTGSRIGWGDAQWSGLATHCVESGQLDDLVGALAQSDDPDKVLGGFAQTPGRDLDDGKVAAIDRLMSGASLSAVISDLDAATADGDGHAVSIADLLTKASPTSLHVAFRQIRAGAALSMQECMAMEFRIVSRMLRGQDFYEGIRAAVIDKDGAPAWQPSRLQDVDAEEIDRYFATLGADELQFTPAHAIEAQQ